MNKSSKFEKELEYIENENYRESAAKLLEQVPDYFFNIPAASTGKYHPSFAQGKGGLVRHTKVAIKIAKEILSLEYMKNVFTEKERDLILISILFHDTIKLGEQEEKYTRFDHPLLAASFIKNNKNLTEFSDEDIGFISKIISSHMGQWNTSSYSNIVLPKPKDKYEFFVHGCDYLASRKFINVEFDKNNNIV